MLQEKIEKYFRQYPGLRVLFFFDEQEEFRKDLESLDLPGIQKLVWENNDFYLKTRLHGDLRTEKILLYLPKAAPRDNKAFHAFPLLGLLLANKELALDDVGEFLDEFQLKRQHKKLAGKYMRELKHATVKDVCRPVLTAANFEEKNLVQGLISSFLRFTSIMPWSILLGKLLTLTLPSQEEELSRFQNKVEDNQLLEFIHEKTHDYFGERLGDLSKDSLLNLLRKVYYNRMTQNLRLSSNDPYKALRMDGSTLVFFNSFLQEASNNRRIQEKLEEALYLVKNDIQSQKLIEAYGQDVTFNWYPEDMLWNLIEAELSNLHINPAGSIERLESLSLQEDLSKALAETLQFLIQSARMFQQIKSIKSYILDTPDLYISTYTNEWMLVDTAYRKAIRHYRHGNMEDAKARLNLDPVINEVNAAYDQHLDTMNREWLKCLNQYDFDYQKIRAPKQYDFYKTEVEPYEQKVVVIISDGLRYEAAIELLNMLHGDPKNTADIRYQLASIPSKTSIGMAQLLPASELSFEDGNISIEGIKTEGISNRHQILSLKNPEAFGTQYSSFRNKSQEELREIFKNKLVYVYHDVIDARGDKSVSEDRTFLAVEETLEELKKFIKSLHATYNVARVLVTADHGFLYQDRTIEEKDKETSPNGKALQNHNRFEISKEQDAVSMGYKLPLSATTKFKDDWFVTIPQSINRYKLQGVGHQYVHGGGSLQELVVPIIDSSRKRQEIAQKVMPTLLQRGQLRIISNILRVQILQTNKVSRFEKEISINIGLYKDLELVSNEQTLLLNSTEEAPSERLHRIDLTLKPVAAKESFLKLKIFDVDDKLNPLIEEVVQNSTLIQTDF
ncbi:MAG: BREX-1 system phosphatase PglZ type A [Lewinellaceae bacterium]|nr:BREX-1 system phosphatase PglZ type A [Saprospiraceae bacterium]MCB9342824.1 BREX-1 system phosphatase PglZ type A [Lewinellaceae bacterium]